MDNYEQKITELMETISELKTLAQLLEAEKKNTENQKKGLLFLLQRQQIIHEWI